MKKKNWLLYLYCEEYKIKELYNVAPLLLRVSSICAQLKPFVNSVTFSTPLQISPMRPFYYCKKSSLSNAKLMLHYTLFSLAMAYIMRTSLWFKMQALIDYIVDLFSMLKQWFKLCAFMSFRGNVLKLCVFCYVHLFAWPSVWMIRHLKFSINTCRTPANTSAWSVFAY